jgi:hypothetical protein
MAIPPMVHPQIIIDHHLIDGGIIKEETEMSQLSTNLNSESTSWVLSCDIFTMMIELYCLRQHGSTSIQACHKDMMVEAAAIGLAYSLSIMAPLRM